MAVSCQLFFISNFEACLCYLFIIYDITHRHVTLLEMSYT